MGMLQYCARNYGVEGLYVAHSMKILNHESFLKSFRIKHGFTMERVKQALNHTILLFFIIITFYC
jgi:hypothetical protein